jgi:CheY-like chemotaxis protein
MVVESAGHSCVAKSSAPEALRYCEKRRPSLAVTDLIMPNVDGRGLAKGLRARHPGLPILLVTGELLDATALSSLHRTFQAVLIKPLEVEPFLALVDELISPTPPTTGLAP